MFGTKIMQQPIPRGLLRRSQHHRLAVGLLATATIMTWALGLGMLAAGFGN